MGRKICFIGFASTSREWANDLPDDWELWGSNECHVFLRRPAHRWYQIHPRNWEADRAKERGFIANGFGRPFYHQHWLAQQTIPVYMQEVDPQIPASVRYPYEKVKDLNWGRQTFLTSTLSYMIAHAVVEQMEHGDIEAYTWAGIELLLGTEYYQQREAFAYYAGRLEGLGVERVWPQSPYRTQLFSEPIYAVDYDRPMQPLFQGEIFGKRK